MGDGEKDGDGKMVRKRGERERERRSDGTKWWTCWGMRPQMTQIWWTMHTDEIITKSSLASDSKGEQGRERKRERKEERKRETVIEGEGERERPQRLICCTGAPGQHSVLWRLSLTCSSMTQAP